MSEPVWTPSPERIAGARITEFLGRVSEEWEVNLPSYDALWHWSVQHPDRFWASLWTYAGVIAEDMGTAVVDDVTRMPGARWFPGARLNFAENLLRWRDDTPAVVFRDERGASRSLTFRELRAEVAGLQVELRRLGVGEGDRVVGFLPNIPEAVIAMLATTSLGAVWSSCSPDFGIQGVLDRFGQIEPKVLFAADGYSYGGRTFESLPRVREITDRLAHLTRVVVVPHLEDRPALDGLGKAVLWPEFTGAGSPDGLTFAPLPFDHPVYVMYSSGTTGLPKCIVHGAGGALLQHLKEHQLHCDLRRGDALFYFTTCGWMMWNWLVSGLATGATVCLYDGSPVHPDADVLWDYAEAEEVTVLGASARYLAACEKAGVTPRDQHDLSSLRAVLSTGSPLAPQSYDWVYRNVKEDLQLSSISGGTDILGCFALGNPIGPVFRGELQTRGLGMDVAVFDEEGRPVREQTGELVCRKAFPSMPVGFWNDDDGSRYRAAYFEHFPGVWRHGDWAEITENDGLVIHGRSDTTLNPGGVRIGTAEIYREVAKVDAVLESLVIGQEWGEDTRVVLFVKLREGRDLDDALVEEIRATVRAGATPRHVPAKVVEVPDIPRTLSGKVVELAAREVVHGRGVKNQDALANPEALDHFRDRPELAD